MANSISIELFPAGNGDAVLIDLGDALILVDGGFTSTFKKHIKPRLKELHNQGRKIDKFIITHIDADHISGAIALIKANEDAATPKIIKIEEVWFNSYRHLHFDEKEVGTFENGKPDFDIPSGAESEDPDDTESLVSTRQGTTLGSLLLKYGYNWNSNFEDQAVKVDQPKTFDVGSTAKLTVLGPTQAELDRLAEDWYDYLQELFPGKINEDEFFDDAFEKMMEEQRQLALEEMEQDLESLVSSGGDWVEDFAVEHENEDVSPTNGSSITFLLNQGNLNLLFLGDAIPSKVESQLDKLGNLSLDVLKVAHHGAWSNNTPSLLGRLGAKHYIFSTNGKRHHHPHFETMAWILKQHQNVENKKFYFNYDQSERLIDVDDEDSKSEFNYDIQWPEPDEDGYLKIELS